MQKSFRSGDDNSVNSRYPKIKLGLTWLIAIPAIVWLMVTYYLPIFSGSLGQIELWTVTSTILALFGFSLLCHILAHIWAARFTGSEIASELTVLIFGDAAQGWPVGASGWREFIVAAAGPLVNFLLAGLAFLVWNVQINQFLNLVMLLVSGFNGWLFMINLIPAFPMDGGRLLRGYMENLLLSPGAGTDLLRRFGFVVATALVGWGIFLLSQRSRFSPQTGAITFMFVILLLDGLKIHPALEIEKPAVQAKYKVRNRSLVMIRVGLLTVLLLAAASTLLLTNNGLEAPGISLPVESMINVPAQYHHSHNGSFYLVTVISEAPITAGEWLMGQVNPAIQIVPPETVVPANTTPQEQAKQNYQMLDDSEVTAIAVGLRLAGYPTSMIGKGAAVTSILASSHANGLLQPGDVITSLNGIPIQTTSDLIEQVKAQSSKGSVDLQIRRGQNEMKISVPLMPAPTPTDSPKIGIAIQSAGFDFKPPFPVSIVTQKINGGPSAGLIFTLTLYNTLTANDLTGGRKIAGTGTINLDGTVGPIGGVKQKIFAAESVGAAYFLCPVENYADAVSVAKSIKVIKIATVQQALDFLRSLPPQS